MLIISADTDESLACHIRDTTVISPAPEGAHVHREETSEVQLVASVGKDFANIE